jgi:hypothetical protein
LRQSAREALRRTVRAHGSTVQQGAYGERGEARDRRQGSRCLPLTDMGEPAGLMSPADRDGHGRGDPRGRLDGLETARSSTAREGHRRIEPCDHAERLRSLLNCCLFVPVDLDDLFEAWVLLQLVELHFRDGWRLHSARLVGFASQVRPQFHLKRGQNEDVEIFYQVVPPNIAQASVYKDIFGDYNIDVSLRRPDIIARISTERFSGALIFEVKRSKNRTYIADAVYKALGYLSDYRAHFRSGKPHLVLVVAGGVEAPPKYREDSEIWIVTESRFREFKLPY